MEMTIEQLKKEFDANDGVISAIKYEGFTKFTCRISGASWAVIKTAKGFQIIAEFIRGAAFSHSKVYEILGELKMIRKFRLTLKGELPIDLVADSKLDAQRQAMDLKRKLNNYRVIDFREVVETNGIMNKIKILNSSFKASLRNTQNPNLR